VSRNIQRNIIIGADAKQFNDAMRGASEATRQVSGEMQSVGTTIFSSVAAAGLLRDGIRAVAAFISNAVDAAMNLPEGFSKAVDEARKLQDVSASINELIGVNMIESGANLTSVFNKVKLAVAGAFSDRTDWTDVLKAWFYDLESIEKLYDAGAADLEEHEEKKQKLKDQEERWKAIQKRMEEVSKEHAKQLKIQEKQSQEMRDYLALSKNFAAIAKEISDEFTDGLFSSGPVSQEMAILSPILNDIKDDMREIWDPLDAEDFTGNLQRINRELMVTHQTASWVGAELFMAFNMASRGGEDFFTNMGVYLKDFIKQMLIAAGVAAVLSAVFGSSIGTFGNIFKGLIGLPKAAHGGIVNGPTPLIAGENGPEAILPLNAMAGMGGNLVTKIQGKDLLIMLDRETNFRARAYA